MMKEKTNKAYFRFYEELNDFLPPKRRKVKFEHRFVGNASVKDMIESLGVPHSEVDLILVNGVSVEFNYLVKNEDLISVYPVFESIDISDVQHLRPKPLRNPKFILDVHLGKLAKLMRILGFDTLYENDYNDEQIVKISKEEKRTILTRDIGILKRNEVTHGYFVRNIKAEKQIIEIIERFNLHKLINPFSRCLECNDLLEPIEKETVINRLPAKVKESQKRFWICKQCNKIYWRGTHYENMSRVLAILNIKNLK
ncbi:hypothetical protein BMS3Abin04_02779 [bacterium BMS3Abin04]|nr:hypothetical protein BMS3Abin04_02779 [bacterium BMS3Abin04]